MINEATRQNSLEWMTGKKEVNGLKFAKTVVPLMQRDRLLQKKDISLQYKLRHDTLVGSTGALLV